MRFQLLIPVAAALALSACGEKPTPKPNLPTTATAPIAATSPAEAPDVAAAPALVCPTQPALVCPPVVAQTAKAKTTSAARHKVRKHKVHAKVKAAPKAKHYAYRRYHGEAPPTKYVERETRHGHYHDTRPPTEDRYATRDADHFHAYGQSGAVEHFARRDDRYDDRRVEDRYSAGGRGYEHYERREDYTYQERSGGHAMTGGTAQSYRSQGGYDARHDAYRADGGSAAYSYSERSSETSRAASSYSEGYADAGAYRHVASGGRGDCCRADDAGAAGRDANGFLTWPGKVPAAPY